MHMNTARFSVSAVVALLVVLGVFLLWYNLSPMRIHRVRSSTESTPSNYNGGNGLHVNLLEAKRTFDNNEAVFIDARTSREYATGHIPGALSVSPADFSSSKALERLRRNQPVITYCSGETCQSSIVLAEMLIGVRGHLDTRVFFGGWDAWVAADYPVATGNPP